MPSTSTEVIRFDRENFYLIQQKLGKRPGDKTVDPFYLRKGLADRPYFWDTKTKKWRLLSLGDTIIVDEDGPRLEKVPKR